MDDMREIVTMQQVELAFRALAIVAPLVGALIGTLVGYRTGRTERVKSGAVSGILIGLLGPVNYLLWKIYNGITDRLGLDSVKNLLINLALFIILGVAAGLISARYWVGRQCPRPAESVDLLPASPLPELGEGER